MILLNFCGLIALAFSVQCAAASEDLVELGCVEDQQCKQFEHANIKSKCLGGHCQCMDANVNGNGTGNDDAVVKCEPQSLKMSNIIGGHCPCNIPHAVCNDDEKICYCAAGFVGSSDKRRCMPANVTLGGKCEIDKQCQAADDFAVCVVGGGGGNGQQQAPICDCAKNFVENNAGKCVAIAAPAATCQNDTDCSVYGEHVICLEDAQQCVCNEGFVKAENETICLATVAYQQNCREHQQCLRLGAGGACLNGTCECGDQHYVLEMQNNTWAGGNVEINVRCIRVIEIGEYCVKDEDCHNRQLPVEAQTMRCQLGECNCKLDYFSTNGTECVAKSNGNFLRTTTRGWLAALVGVAVVALNF